ncbi:MAG: c-type cytochrome [Gammaproteobacteria bacterium]|jgi:cbb3-type cytochrome c oxidase subunit II|nr:c-type cytochrome [Gammaproteobacteria bacterium]MBT3858999.1 c-type cytochrome [Gammaproteobacteria bacterium]MBT3988049.1 c-type cytochrome [Gammaproteobacteria bacterium]MBT4256121.1 c-type cytochrome [Gammaproteobacteria bacterium]MBT4583446.1 c-type cytochrome [Gammaproteobacteria bacterium]
MKKENKLMQSHSDPLIQSDPDINQPIVDSLLVRAHSIAAFITLLIAVTFGILVSLQFIIPDFAGDVLPTWGRMRYAHTQGIMLGWLGNGFLGFLYYAVPILSGRAVSSHKLGLILFALWNFAVMLPGWILVLSGVSQPLEWAEFPLVVDVVVVVAFILAAIQFLPPFFSRGFENLYVSSWYIIGALVFTLMSFPMGNIVPEFVPGAAGAAFSGLWIHDAVGLFVTPLALAILYFVIPASTGRPIYSHFLSMLGFWGLFFLYPLNGIHHYISSVIPMGAQITAIAASFLLGVVVIIVVSNLMLSQRGSGLIPRDIALRFASMAVVFYLIVSIQGSWQADMSFNSLTHFTDWVIGHSHLAMLGFATFASIAGIVHAWQRLPEVSYDARALDWAYWLLTIGITLMVVDLSIAGIIQGQLWQDGAPWLESVTASQTYWLVRSLSAIPITLGFVLLFKGLLGSSEERAAITNAEHSNSGVEHTATDDKGAASALRYSYLVASLAGVGFFIFSVSLLGVMPFKQLQEEAASLAPADPLPMTASESRGREIYAREGCSYCHTQQVRYTEPDMERFGAPTLAWEGRQDFPHMLGTRRIGPDLAKAGNTRPAQWHLAHLFSPRSVVPQSVMPAYPEFFNNSPTRPRREALDLVAYLDSLGRDRELAWPEGDQIAKAGTDDERALMSFNAEELNAHPGRTRPRGEAPDFGAASAAVSGEELWQNNCSGCHGEQGRGDGPAAAWLEPAPVDLSKHRYQADLLADILWNGVHGTSMPAWRDLPLSDLSALVSVIQSYSEVDPTSGIPQQLPLGEEVYASNCAECHGDNGDGNGFAADSLPIPISPSDFTREQLSEAESLRILQNGIEGTSMVPWGDRLGEGEMVAVVHYIRSLFGSGENSGAAND